RFPPVSVTARSYSDENVDRSRWLRRLTRMEAHAISTAVAAARAMRMYTHVGMSSTSVFVCGVSVRAPFTVVPGRWIEKRLRAIRTVRGAHGAPSPEA